MRCRNIMIVYNAPRSKIIVFHLEWKKCLYYIGVKKCDFEVPTANGNLS